MPAGKTYEPIATTTVTSAVSNVTFSSIPSTYTDLVLVVNPLSTSSAGVDIYMQFNSDTNTNYSVTFVYGNGSSSTSGRTTNATQLRLAYNGTNDNPMLRYNIMNYSNSTTRKVIVGGDDAASNVTAMSTGIWRSTAAISSIKLYASSGNITGGTFTIYGITAA